MFGNFTCLVLGLTVIAGSLIYPVWRALRADKHCLLLFAMFIQVEKMWQGATSWKDSLHTSAAGNKH